jgi:Metallo-peptidase family M12/Fibronectin type III domain/Secretion system C-terminal sorting domain
MRKKSFFRFMLTGMLLIGCLIGLAQKVQKPVDLVRGALQRNAAFTTLDIPLSKTATDAYAPTMKHQVKEYSLFTFNRSENATLKEGIPLEVSLYAAEGNITLQLVPVNIFSDRFSAVTSSGEKLRTTGWFYQGIIKGNENSVAAISIFEDEIAGFISSSKGNFVVGKLRNANEREPVNIIYKETSLLTKPTYNCSTPDITLPTPATVQTELTARCVCIDYETEVDFYNAFGNNATAVTNYVVNLFNQNRTLFNNDGISVALGQILVWTTADPYTGTNSGSLLSQFQSYRTSIVGNVRQLITTRNIGGGQAAVIYGLCSSVANSLCVSGDLTTSFPNVSAFSWEVYVTTHELGHLMGSRHTHACVWNGNNTAFDGCGQYAGYFEGNCGYGPIPGTGGTIMSYCHLNGVGINFNNGFGSQPGAQIRNSVEASWCLASCATPCSSPLTGLTASNIGNYEATLSWNSLGGEATGYTLEFKSVGSATWVVIGPIVFNSYTVSGLAPGTQYEWRVKAHCAGGVTTPYANASFTTAPLPGACGTPTGLYAQPDGCNFTAYLNWSAVIGATSYTVERKRTTETVYTVLAANHPYTSIDAPGFGLYNWRVMANCPSGSGNYSAVGSYSVRYNSKICDPYLRPATGAGAINLKLNPQPADRQVNISFDADKQVSAILSVHDQFGVTFLRKTVRANSGSNTVQIDVSNLRPGIYVLKLQLDGKIGSEKLVVGKQ